jgi:hypothetical protein
LNADTVARNLRFLAHHLRSLLERDSYSNLLEAASYVKTFSSSGRPKSKQQPWEVYIDSGKSLRFLPSELDKRLAPDIFCDIQGPSDGQRPLSKQNLVVRIWSLNKDLSFRNKWDSDELDRLLTQGHSTRVMLRLHFDRADESQEALLFHLQIGGRPTEPERELCWIPKEMDLPRLLYPPIDLVLASELVVANFFPMAFRDLTRTPEWVSLVNESESFLLRDFYGKCHDICDRGVGKGTILNSWWHYRTA